MAHDQVTPEEPKGIKRLHAAAIRAPYLIVAWVFWLLSWIGLALSSWLAFLGIRYAFHEFWHATTHGHDSDICIVVCRRLVEAGYLQPDQAEEACAAAGMETGFTFNLIVHALLHTIELLLLVPLPAIVGHVIYISLVKFLHPDSHDRDIVRSRIEANMTLTKRLIFGILVAAAGSRMLDDFLHGEDAVEHFAAGAILILSAGIYAFLAFRGVGRPAQQSGGAAIAGNERKPDK